VQITVWRLWLITRWYQSFASWFGLRIALAFGQATRPAARVWSQLTRPHSVDCASSHSLPPMITCAAMSRVLAPWSPSSW
jgi:hypothetical protein